MDKVEKALAEALADGMILNKVEEAITAYWGEECEEYVEGCACCEAWAEWKAFESEENIDITLNDGIDSINE